ncbi:outer membrane lipoprotein-sorting protein [Lewinella sp. IMCC34191]|uniref:outer membrane lipoprotein-sorting protein n=1 Tax=Lewinella sp. IMCC34191 TaxID=2259172 RepID=UPI000E251FE7|nr:outer membrane lipoprotein-sorting protein [Lewinella sp. IMCC34191]
MTLFIMLAVGCFLPLSAQTAVDAPPAREIADAYIETIGGADAWKALQAYQFEGKANMQGMEFPITVTSAEGDKTRVELNIQGNQMVQAYDGTTAWMYFPMQGITEPKEMSAEEAADLTSSPFLDVFVDTEARGYTLENVEGRELDGTPTYGVLVTNDEGFSRTYYFDTETMVPVMMSFTSEGGQMKGMTMETYLSDYQEVDNVIIPMYMENKVNGQTVMAMTFETAAINPELPENFFSMDSM